MEDGPRYFQCQGCPKKLRIFVHEEDAGKDIEIKCPNCLATLRVKLPAPPSSMLKDIFDGLYAAFATGLPKKKK